MYLFLGDDERRRQADDISVSRFSEQSGLCECEADVPGGLTLRRIVDEDGVKQPFPAHQADQR